MKKNNPLNFFQTSVCLGFVFVILNLHSASASEAPTDTLAVAKSTLDSFVSEPINPQLLKGYDRQIRDSSTNYKRRFQRSLILLKHGEPGPPVAEDIDTLMHHPDWMGEGNRLQAFRLYLIGRGAEAKNLIRQNIRNNIHQHEQAQFLAALELSEKDTAGAYDVYRLAWDLFKDENVYIDWLNLYRIQKKVPEDLLQQGLQLYPHSPGPMLAIFETYLTRGTQADCRQCEKISGRAETVLWPKSVDWKVRHAQALMALKKFKDAEVVLNHALELMEDDPRMQTNSDDLPALRQKIFTMLETVHRFF